MHLPLISPQTPGRRSRAHTASGGNRAPLAFMTILADADLASVSGGINPQPLPPHISAAFAMRAVMLNPQPLPP